MIRFALILSVLFTLPLASPAQAADRKLPTAEARATFTEKLAAGRKATKSGKHDEAAALYREALKAMPGNPSALGELGWTLFLAGKFEEARTHTGSAEYLSKRPAQKGALRYNLGRIAEALGKPDEAREHYSRSLLVRENETVRKRVAGLGGTVDIPEALTEAPEKLQETAPALADPAALVAAEVGPYCNPLAAKDTGEGECVAKTERDLTAAGGGFSIARLVRVTGQAEMGGSVDAQVLIVKGDTPTWWGLGIVADSWTPGFDYIHNNGEVAELALGDLAPELAGVELELRTSAGFVDMNPGDEEAETIDSESWTFCGQIGGARRCLTVQTRVSWTTSQLDGWDVGKTKSGGEVALELTRKGASITIKRVKGKLEKDQKACIGTFTLEKLATLPCTTVRILEEPTP